VHLAAFPRFETALLDAELEARYERLLAVRSDVSKALELARGEKLIGHSLDARVLIEAPAGEWRELLERHRDELATLFIVSQAELAEGLEGAVPGEEVKGLRIRVEKAAGVKCERCWNYATTVGESDEHPTVCHRCRER
jgi:isoleucyl-tRNA synthetase